MRTLALGAFVGLLFAACGPIPSMSADGRLVVVTTSTVFADLVAQVGGDLVSVTSLVPKNADIHTFEPRPGDVRAVARAKLLVMNGLGADDWLSKTIANATVGSTPLLVLSDAVPADERLGPANAPNPHLWMDPELGKAFVARIGTELAAVDPGHAAAYTSGAAAYAARLDALEASIRSTLVAVPAPDRRIVTFHDAFPYFARAFGLQVVGVAVEAPGQEPSAAQMAALISAIRASGVKVILAERQFPTRLVDAIAAETGAKVVSNLYSDSLGDPPVTTYEAMLRWDADRIAEAFR